MPPMFTRYEQIDVGAVAKDVAALTIPPTATHAELQADTGSVRYTMDGTAPSSSFGMLLLVTERPQGFLVEDLRRIQFIQGSGAAKLNIHYYSG